MFTDITSGKEYLRPINEIKENGLELELNAFQYHVFMDFSTFENDKKDLWKKLFKRFGYQGLESWQKQYKKFEMGPVLEPCKAIVNEEVFDILFDIKQKKIKSEGFLPEFKFRLEEFEDAVGDFVNVETPSKFASRIKNKFKNFIQLPLISFEDRDKDYFIFIWIFISNFESMLQKGKKKDEESENKLSIKFLVDDFFDEYFGDYGAKLDGMIDFFLELQKSKNAYDSISDCLVNLLKLEKVKKLINVNKWEDTYWLNRELLEYFYQILWYFYLDKNNIKWSKLLKNEIEKAFSLFEKSEFKYDSLLNLLEETSNGKKKKK